MGEAGTCTPLKAPQYFEWSLRKIQKTSGKLALPVDHLISKAEFEKQVAAKLPELQAAFNLSCKGDRLDTLSVPYAWAKDGPGSPIKNTSGKNSIPARTRS